LVNLFFLRGLLLLILDEVERLAYFRLGKHHVLKNVLAVDLAFLSQKLVHLHFPLVVLATAGQELG